MVVSFSPESLRNTSYSGSSSVLSSSPSSSRAFHFIRSMPSERNAASSGLLSFIVCILPSASPAAAISCLTVSWYVSSGISSKAFATISSFPMAAAGAAAAAVFSSSSSSLASSFMLPVILPAILTGSSTPAEGLFLRNTGMAGSFRALISSLLRILLSGPEPPRLFKLSGPEGRLSVVAGTVPRAVSAGLYTFGALAYSCVSSYQVFARAS